MRNLSTLKRHLKKQLINFYSSVIMSEDNIYKNWKLNVLPKLRRMKEEAYENRVTLNETKKKESKEKRKEKAVKSKSLSNQADEPSREPCTSRSYMKIKLLKNENRRECKEQKIKNISACVDHKKEPEKKNKKSKKKCQNMSQAMIDAQREKWREKKRKYRERVSADPERSAKAKLYERERNRKRKVKGQLKKIADMKKREQNRQRKKWREASKRYYQKKKISQETRVFIDENTPPSSPLPLEETIEHRVEETRRQQAGRRRQKQNTERKRQEVLALKKMLYIANKNKEKWKKKHHRLVDTSKSSPSPGQEVDSLLKRGDIKEVKRNLLFWAALTKQKMLKMFKPKVENIIFPNALQENILENTNVVQNSENWD